MSCRLPGMTVGLPSEVEKTRPDAAGRDTKGRDTKGRDTKGRDAKGRDTEGRDTEDRFSMAILE